MVMPNCTLYVTWHFRDPCPAVLSTYFILFALEFILTLAGFRASILIYRKLKVLPWTHESPADALPPPPVPQLQLIPPPYEDPPPPYFEFASDSSSDSDYSSAQEDV